MIRFFVILALVATAAAGCCEPQPAPPPAPCECPPAPAPAADCADLSAALESCQAKLRECEQDPFKGGKYLTGEEPPAGKPAP
jgi:hypothetical protein